MVRREVTRLINDTISLMVNDLCGSTYHMILYRCLLKVKCAIDRGVATAYSLTSLLDLTGKDKKNGQMERHFLKVTDKAECIPQFCLCLYCTQILPDQNIPVHSEGTCLE